jgi:hypothetical protein
VSLKKIGVVPIRFKFKEGSELQFRLRMEFSLSSSRTILVALFICTTAMSTLIPTISGRSLTLQPDHAVSKRSPLAIQFDEIDSVAPTKLEETAEHADGRSRNRRDVTANAAQSSKSKSLPLPHYVSLPFIILVYCYMMYYIFIDMVFLNCGGQSPIDVVVAT